MADISPAGPGVVKLPYAQWLARGTQLFGPDRMLWRFRCPICGHVAAVQDWRAAGAPEGTVGFSCVGRWLPGSRRAFGGQGPGPCDYAGGGLFQCNPIRVTREDPDTGAEIVYQVFDFDCPPGTYPELV